MLGRTLLRCRVGFLLTVDDWSFAVRVASVTPEPTSRNSSSSSSWTQCNKQQALWRQQQLTRTRLLRWPTNASSYTAILYGHWFEWVPNKNVMFAISDPPLVRFWGKIMLLSFFSRECSVVLKSCTSIRTECAFKNLHGKTAEIAYKFDILYSMQPNCEYVCPCCMFLPMPAAHALMIRWLSLSVTQMRKWNVCELTTVAALGR